jgi:NitT/TauT family transport system permease protein
VSDEVLQDAEPEASGEGPPEGGRPEVEANAEAQAKAEASKASAGFATRVGLAVSGFFVIRRHVPAWQRWILGTLPILAILGLWWLVTGGGPAEERIISPVILPSPLEVLHSFRALWFERALTRNVVVSFTRVLEGFAVGVGLAFPLGVAMGSFSKVKATFNPLAVLGAYLPIPALVPLTLSLFGTGEKQKVAFLGMAFIIYLLPLVVAAVEQVDQVYLKTAYTLGASRWQAVTKVLLPIAWPDIYQSLRMGFGIGWSYILLAEMVDIGKGLGGIIITSQRRGPREHIYLVLLVIVAMAFLTDKVWETLGRMLFPNRESRR